MSADYKAKQFFKKQAVLILIVFLLFHENLLAGIPDTSISAADNGTSETLTDFFSFADRFLGRYTESGKVDYASIKAEQTEILHLAEMISKADMSASDSNTKIAFYLNAYNLLTIHSVVQHLPIQSPLDVTGFFDKNKFFVAGEYLTLNDIENKKLRPDPRIHFSLVCAAKGCPKLSSHAFQPATVQQQLNANTMRTLNDPGFIQINDATKTVSVSKIFEWYRADFITDNKDILSFINRYRENKIPEDYNYTPYAYDWTLNQK